MSQQASILNRHTDKNKKNLNSNRSETLPRTYQY